MFTKSGTVADSNRLTQKLYDLNKLSLSDLEAAITELKQHRDRNIELADPATHSDGKILDETLRALYEQAGKIYVVVGDEKYDAVLMFDETDERNGLEESFFTEEAFMTVEVENPEVVDDNPLDPNTVRAQDIMGDAVWEAMRGMVITDGMPLEDPVEVRRTWADVGVNIPAVDPASDLDGKNANEGSDTSDFNSERDVDYESVASEEDITWAGADTRTLQCTIRNPGKYQAEDTAQSIDTLRNYDYYITDIVTLRKRHIELTTNPSPAAHPVALVIFTETEELNGDNPENVSFAINKIAGKLGEACCAFMEARNLRIGHLIKTVEEVIEKREGKRV